jgi:hypothetical protein
VFPTAIATKGPAGGGASGGAGRPAVAQKPSYLTGGAGPTGHLSAKRGTEDLDYFIGDEALAQAAGPGTDSLEDEKAIYMLLLMDEIRIQHQLSYTARPGRQLGMRILL